MKFTDSRTGENVLTLDERDLPEGFTQYKEMADGEGKGGRKVFKATITSDLPRR